MLPVVDAFAPTAVAEETLPPLLLAQKQQEAVQLICSCSAPTERVVVISLQPPPPIKTQAGLVSGGAAGTLLGRPRSQRQAAAQAVTPTTIRAPQSIAARRSTEYGAQA